MNLLLFLILCIPAVDQLPHLEWMEKGGGGTVPSSQIVEPKVWKDGERCPCCGCKPVKYRQLKEKDQQRKFHMLGTGIAIESRDALIRELKAKIDALEAKVGE